MTSQKLFIALFAIVFSCSGLAAAAEPDTLRHEELRRFPALEAKQGVAVDAEFFYAIDNHAIGKYRKDTGTRVGGWAGEKGGRIKHLNAGFVLDGKLYCAHSNFPNLPEQSSVEMWDTKTMQHVDEHRFANPPGSLTWIDRRDGAWFACFAHYKKTSDPARTQVVKFDTDWKPLATWRFPAALIERFAGNSSSGGAFGPSGELFVTGHDARELYALELPEGGGELRWRATIPISAAGQAFAWDRSDTGALYSIERKTREVIVSRVHGDPRASSKRTSAVEPALPERGLCAHRGAMSTHPENTLPAFAEALRLGAHMIEFDVQLTRDGALVLMHDATVDRTTDGKGKVADLTLAELRELDAGGRMDPRFAGTRIPTFEETLEMMPRNVWLNCHLKGGAALGAATARVIARTNRQHQAFLAATASAAKAAREAVPGILICNMERQGDSMAYARETIAMKAAFIQLLGKGEVPVEAVKLLRAAGVRVNYYHDETPDGLRRQWSSGVNFPLVNDLAAALPVARENGIAPLTH